MLLIDSGEPSCYKEAMLVGDKSQWELAMKSEISSIEQNKTWELVPLPKDKKLYHVNGSSKKGLRPLLLRLSTSQDCS